MIRQVVHYEMTHLIISKITDIAYLLIYERMYHYYMYIRFTKVKIYK